MSKEPRPGNKLISFLMVLFVLTLGIGIGTLITYRAGAQGPGDSHLKIQTDGKPLIGGAALTLSQAFEEVAKRVEPAVVNINTEELVKVRTPRRTPGPQNPEEDPMQDFFHRFFGAPGQGLMPDQYTRHSLGSGIIVDPKGYIVTNNHVVDGASKIKVTVPGGEEYPARVISADSLSDIAVIKIDGKKEFAVAKIGDAKAMKVGDWVLAVGSPFGLEQTVTAGIISATGRVFDTSPPDTPQILFNDYLQTDAAINPGNSGGPLVNMNGEVVGINSFIQTQSRSSAGVGFAVPSHIFVNVYNQILEKGKVTRGWLGVNMNTLPFTPAMANYFGVKQGGGVLITGLNDEKGNPSNTGPAARAGIKPEDVIVEFGGKKILSVQDLRLAVANTPPGSHAKVKAIRRSEEKVFDVIIVERTLESQAAAGGFSFEEKEEPPKPEIGFRIDAVPPRLAQDLEITGGAQVLSVNPGSLAEDAGLVGQEQGGGSGDIIVEANGKKVETAQDLLAIVKNLKSGDAVVIKFLRVKGRNQNRQLVTDTFFTSITKP
jgi:serine protease Do